MGIQGHAHRDTPLANAGGGPTFIDAAASLAPWGNAALSDDLQMKSVHDALDDARDGHDRRGTSFAPSTLLEPKPGSKDFEWCGAYAATHVEQAAENANPLSKSNHSKLDWNLKKNLGQKLASTNKIKKGFASEQMYDTGVGDERLAGQYLSWHTKDAAENHTQMADLSGNTQQDAAKMGAGDLMLLDWKDNGLSKAGDHVTMVTGTSTEGKNLAFVHTVEGNAPGMHFDSDADAAAHKGKVEKKYSEAENTYLMVPRKDKSGAVTGYDAVRFAIQVGDKAMDVPALIELGKSDPSNDYALHVTDDTTPEEVVEQLHEIQKKVEEQNEKIEKENRKKKGKDKKEKITVVRRDAQIDGQLDFETVGAAPGPKTGASAGGKTGTITTPTVTQEPPEKAPKS